MWISKADIWWKAPCVYALFKDGQIIWIGQTKNLAGRLSEHLGARDFDHVWFEYCREEELNNIEQYLLLQALPSQNVRLIVTAAAWFQWVDRYNLRRPNAQ